MFHALKLTSAENLFVVTNADKTSRKQVEKHSLSHGVKKSITCSRALEALEADPSKSTYDVVGLHLVLQT